MEDRYRLQRGLPQTLRLNLQQYLIAGQLGYNLHPSIDVHKESLKVADVGTGTGIWLTEVARELSSNAQLSGFDVSAAQFPHKNSLPANVTLATANALEAPPLNVRGAFDIVHVRLFKPVVQNNDPGAVIEHVKALLKPGGYVMWFEFDTSQLQAMGTGADSKNGAASKVLNLLGDDGSDWLPRLPQFLEKHSLEHIATDIRRIPPWQRQMMLENFCHVADDKAAMRVNRKLQPVQYHDDMKAAIQQVLEESRRGLYFDAVAQVVVGRKPG